jgi:hypothetical protein
VRDDAGLVQFKSYDIATRRAIEERVARHPQTPRPAPSVPRPAPATASATPDAPSVSMTVSLANFFDRYGGFVWPSDAPTNPDLLAVRHESDQAVAAVRKEYDALGIASVSTVADARFKLLEYGRPALEHIRSTSTPAIADMFHVFLLSLYRNLEVATAVRQGPTTSGGN